jgi:hypothetical protein
MIQTLRVLRLGVVAMMCLTAADCPDKTTVPTPVFPSISIVPSLPITLQTGQQATVIAIVTGLVTNTVGYSSSNPAAVSVNPTTGVVTCITPGTAVITAQSTESATVRTSVVVECVEPTPPATPPPTVLIQVSGGPFSFTHIVGTTSCPQRVGVVRVNNVGGVVIQMTAAPGSTAIRLDPNDFTLSAGGNRDVAVDFNCSTTLPFLANLNFTARSGSVTDTKTLQVIGQVRR